MQVPLQITFRGFPPSEAIEKRVREEAEKLERFYDRIISCRVVLESPHQHHHKGNLFHTAIYLTVPGGDLEVTREPPAKQEHEDVYVSVRDAFREATRLLEEHGRKRKNRVKRHDEAPHGRVASLFADHGFIRTSDERDVYFHKNALVAGDFGKLTVGVEVRFAEELGEKGPQASTVTPVSKRHPRP